MLRTQLRLSSRLREKIMKARYRLIRRGVRGGAFYCVDTGTGKRTSLGTSDEDTARQILEAKNNAVRQPAINLQIAKAYMVTTRIAVPVAVASRFSAKLSTPKQPECFLTDLVVSSLSRTLLRADQSLRRSSAIGREYCHDGPSLTPTPKPRAHLFQSIFAQSTSAGLVSCCRTFL
jgi:hypothetical protein